MILGMTRPVDGFSYEVQSFTGRDVDRSPTNRWARGSIIRFAQPQFRSTTWDLFMYDPTNPLTWNNAER